MIPHKFIVVIDKESNPSRQHHILETIKNATVIYAYVFFFLLIALLQELFMFRMVYLSPESGLANIGLSCTLLFEIVLKNDKIITYVILNF